MPFDEAHPQLYAKREAIHPKLVKGKYRLIKWAVLFVTLGTYYTLPWLRWPRAPHEPSQAVLVDFAGSRLYFFGIEIWPDEFYLVTGVLVLSALLLFLTTAIWGRLWCGYACPQTVWTDLYIAVERMIEGDRNKRLQLAKKPWTADKIAKKVAKHSLWLLIAACTGGAWVLYFHDAPTVIRGLFSGEAPGSSYIFIGLLTFTTYTLAGMMREQVCTYMCPWPRIQGAMTDAETFQVGYYALRGEPRGKHKKGADWSKLGDCIDCNGCVVACPMGIDIRDGDQLECINCGLCVDACDAVMAKVGLPKALIAYGNDYTRVKDPKDRRRFPKIFRPRIYIYLAAIFLVSVLMLVGFQSRESVEFGLERDRAVLATTLSDGSIRNAVTARILNKDSEPREFMLSVSGPDALEVSAVGRDVEDRSIAFTVPGDRQVKVRLFLTLPAEAQRHEEIDLTLTDLASGETTTRTMSFVRAGPNG
ncbi:cytochrome c oxidase accessory protein CcoG [Parvularcula lutaonensis]|uniref:Cytochrome c oxidase accessory protein CcoG n=1 Tax=Parvularcula lutaonensis TaxID=491923 RepID=A0ABV7M9W3_9PROT|nr:cytochrome c oxidase accessory protein CcoG [Parvularcula lutaonensis]